MIKQASIEEVRNRADLVEVVGRYATVKKNMACCPIHDEKSPSFHLYTAKQQYKCFGCGESGDSIGLVMKMERLNFVEAVEYLAKHYNITLEYDQAKQQEPQETKDLRQEELSLASWAHKQYRKSLQELPADAAALQYLQTRGYGHEQIETWEIGFAPDDWKFVTTPIINMGKHKAGVECGLIGSKEGKSWDFHRNRITLPIHDQNGIVVGIASRMIPTGNAAADKDLVKWFNPCESLVYNKKKVWYGLWQAQKAIRAKGFAYLVEGYFDVQRMQDGPALNTIAASGTEVDELQAKFLKRYTDHIVLAFDGDGPGIKKMLKLVDVFLKLDFRVEVLSLPKGMDPDEYVRSLMDAQTATTTNTLTA